MFATKFMDHAAYAKKVKKMTYSELHFTIKDCREVLMLMKSAIVLMSFDVGRKTMNS
jgi:hypothetical protein